MLKYLDGTDLNVFCEKCLLKIVDNEKEELTKLN